MAAKAQSKNKLSGIWNIYQKAGDKLERKTKPCPKCGNGVFMAKHSSRMTCGNCHYTIFETQYK